MTAIRTHNTVSLDNIDDIDPTMRNSLGANTGKNNRSSNAAKQFV